MLKLLSFGSSNIKIDKNDIVKEGYLKKESRVFKTWRE